MRKLLFASLIAAFQLWTPAAQALDLMQAYQQALASDPVYASARYALQAGAERSVQGRAGLLPAVAAQGTVERGEVKRSGASSANSRSRSYALVLSQPLLRWANWEQYQQSKLSVAASEAEFAQAQQDLVVRVADAYFDVLAAHDSLASVQAQKIAITEQLASAQRNFDVGTATITDTHEAQARFDLTVAQELAAESELELRRAALEQIIGAPAGALAQLRQGVVLQAPEPAQIADWVTSAQSQNYGVIGAQLSRAIAQREIRKNRAAHLPTVDLVASRSHSNRRGAIGYDPASPVTPSGATDSTSIGIEWNIPLFSGFATTSRVREAVSLEGQARADLETVRRNAAQGARQAYLGVHSGLAQVRALEAAELSSRSALESNQLGYEVGVRINIDVLNAQQQLYETRRDLAQARYNTLLSSLQLKAAAGILSEDDLVQINQLLSTDLRHTAFQTLAPLAPHQNAAPLAPAPNREQAIAQEPPR